MGIAIAIALLGALFVTDNQEFFDKVDGQALFDDTYFFLNSKFFHE